MELKHSQQLSLLLLSGEENKTESESSDRRQSRCQQEYYYWMDIFIIITIIISIDIMFIATNWLDRSCARGWNRAIIKICIQIVVFNSI